MKLTLTILWFNISTISNLLFFKQIMKETGEKVEQKELEEKN